MFQLMKQNISLNKLDSQVNASVYDWGAPTPANIPQHPDIILAADCVYFEPAFPLLQQTLQDLIGETTVCYFCFKKRRRADLQFMKAVKKKFQVEEVNDDPDKEHYTRQNLFLYVYYLQICEIGLIQTKVPHRKEDLRGNRLVMHPCTYIRPNPRVSAKYSIESIACESNVRAVNMDAWPEG